jgi:RNA polymerase sigma factor (sigma-70 family)
MQQTSYQQNDNWTTFNDLAKRTLSYTSLEKEDLNKIFLQIEKLIYYGVDLILHSTTFIEDNLCYLLAEIASGVIKSRKIYKGKRVRQRVALNEEIEMGAENKRIFGIGFDLFKLSRMNRGDAVPFTKRIIRTLRISSSHYENILTAFEKSGSQYIELSDELASVTLALVERRQFKAADPSDEGDSEKEMNTRAEELIDQMDLLELDLGCVEPNLLYGTIRGVLKVMKRVRLLQERILRAYSRLVLKPVKGRAQNEMEALDLFQSGSLGLARAISLYDPRCGTSFPTFANWWIRQKILGSAKHSGSLIKLPSSVIERYQEILRAERHFEADPLRCSTYTVEDVAKYCNTTVRSVEGVKRKVRGTRVVSLESMTVVNEEGYENDSTTDVSVMDDLSDEDTQVQHTSEFITQVLNHINDDERKLVCLRYGVIDKLEAHIDPKEEIREIFRQGACKAYLQHSMSVRVNNRLILAQPEELSD